MDYAYSCFTDKIIVCGDYIRFKNYLYPYSLGIEKKSKVDYSVKRIEDDKREDNLKRARDNVADIVYCNLSEYTKFLTLTCKETVLEVKKFERMITTFLQAMKRGSYKLEYIYVLERQIERGKKEGNIGCLHAHMIVFNKEKIPMNILKKCWKYGRTELKILNGCRCEDDKETAELIKNPAGYVCKYITKESVAEWNKKTYRCSKGIIRPVPLTVKAWRYNDKNGSMYIETEKEWLETLETYKNLTECVYQNVYKVDFKNAEGVEAYQIINDSLAVFR